MTPFEIFLAVVVLVPLLCVAFSTVPLSRLQFGLLIGLVSVVALGAWLCAIRASQLAPHHIITSINGHVLDDEVFTNNYTVITGWRHEVTTNGYVLVSYPVTNELWHVWRIFR